MPQVVGPTRQQLRGAAFDRAGQGLQYMRANQLQVAETLGKRIEQIVQSNYGGDWSKAFRDQNLQPMFAQYYQNAMGLFPGRRMAAGLTDPSNRLAQTMPQLGNESAEAVWRGDIRSNMSTPYRGEQPQLEPEPAAPVGPMDGGPKIRPRRPTQVPDRPGKPDKPTPLVSEGTEAPTPEGDRYPEYVDVFHSGASGRTLADHQTFVEAPLTRQEAIHYSIRYDVEQMARAGIQLEPSVLQALVQQGMGVINRNPNFVGDPVDPNTEMSLILEAGRIWKENQAPPQPVDLRTPSQQAADEYLGRQDVMEAARTNQIPPGMGVPPAGGGPIPPLEEEQELLDRWIPTPEAPRLPMAPTDAKLNQMFPRVGGRTASIPSDAPVYEPTLPEPNPEQPTLSGTVDFDRISEEAKKAAMVARASERTPVQTVLAANAMVSGASFEDLPFYKDPAEWEQWQTRHPKEARQSTRELERLRQWTVTLDRRADPNGYLNAQFLAQGLANVDREFGQGSTNTLLEAAMGPAYREQRQLDQKDRELDLRGQELTEGMHQFDEMLRTYDYTSYLKWAELDLNSRYKAIALAINTMLDTGDQDNEYLKQVNTTLDLIAGQLTPIFETEAEIIAEHGRESPQYLKWYDGLTKSTILKPYLDMMAKLASVAVGGRSFQTNDILDIGFGLFRLRQPRRTAASIETPSAGLDGGPAVDGAGTTPESQALIDRYRQR